jgi:hypothetical protein
MQVKTIQVKTVKGSGAKRFPVQSVVMVQAEADGSVTRTTLSKGSAKRRVSKRWRGVDKALRRISLAQQTTAEEYRQRHERSNNKKKNGAIRDLGKNLVRSVRKGRKKLKLRFL